MAKIKACFAVLNIAARTKRGRESGASAAHTFAQNAQRSSAHAKKKVFHSYSGI
jgi:hypothetical protein